MCKAGANCRRALCFFAHSQAELRQTDKAEGAAHPSVVQLASAAAAMAAGPAGAAFPACPGFDGVSALPLPSAGLAINTTGLDSSGSSNVSCATCQPGASPTALHDFSGDLSGPGRNLGSSGNLQLQSVPVTAGLLAQMPQAQLPQALLGSPYPAVSAAAAAAAGGLMTSMPQLQEFLQQQQQQLVAGIAAMGLSNNAPVLVEQLQPSTAISNLVGGAGSLPVATAAAVAAPIYSRVMQGVPAVAGYVQGVPLMQQAAMPGMALQQVYQQGGYQVQGVHVPGGMQYTWM